MASLEQLVFDNSYARLPPGFAARVAPAPFPDAHVVSVNPAALRLLGLDAEEAARPEFARVFGGATPLPGMEPLAMVYAGHQFGVYVPRLGDGRALLLGEVRGPDGDRWDLQLKGGGPTPFSRGGDGRAVLRSTVREYLASEALHALGIPTTRALCILGSRTPVYREEVETGAMLVRLAPSHVRFGTFEFFHHTEQPGHVATLADHVIAAHFPHLAGQEGRHARFFAEVVERTAQLVARWQAVGFAHGVMNTDNMSILGLTLDYGPYGFLDDFDPGFVCNHSDHQGRYAFDQQPRVALWNLACLGEALLTLITEDEARATLSLFQPTFARHFLTRMREKLGLTQGRDEDRSLLEDLFTLMAGSHVDYARFFRALNRFDSSPGARNDALRDHFLPPEGFDGWAERYRVRLESEGSVDGERHARLDRVNPKYVLRNWVAQQAIARAQEGDFAEVDRVLALVSAPFDEHPGQEAYAASPPTWGRHLVVSCSS
ncbi:YdiU family protein [Corallococcus exiguus]|uniref:protein adenylyltransferase SelO n=1 Tax=Corallococcus TaxID=83461 RepID=UPI000ECE796B|nr:MULTISPECIES: YdiU family protein [Corallococcus]NNB94264.1 YdiU family protein [Corallococcus exiguus]NPC49475.1 YdiU family protein [Corallococcus exiguus]RKH77667.1 YdiU family protein [Corallococcus sp. AB032C]